MSIYSHASNQLGGCSKVTTVRSLVFDDVNRLLWHGYTVAIAAPSDGPPTSLGVGAGANPNRTLLFSLSVCFCSSSSLLFPIRLSTTRSFLPGVSSAERIIDRPLEIPSSHRQSDLFLTAASIDQLSMRRLSIY